MAQGFPRFAISTVYCTHDGGELELDQPQDLSDQADSIVNGLLVCRKCQRSYSITDGILDVCDESALDVESRHELKLREQLYGEAIAADEPAWWDGSELEKAEMTPTIDSLSADGSHSLLELGCGDGRYTTALVDRFRWILAVDFSIEALRRLQRRVAGRTNVALVRGDISTLKLQPGSFDRALSTLVSNLPTPEHRDSMYTLAGKAVGPNGRFVFSTHNHGFWPLVFGEKKSERYEEGGMFRHNMTAKDCRSEAGRFFNEVKAWPIQIKLPFSYSLKFPQYRISRALEGVPVFGSFGMIALCTAEKPAV